MTHRLSRTLSSVLALLVGTGCISATTMQQANTVGKGRSQFAAEPAILTLASKGSLPVQLPVGGFAGRWGVTDDLDVGFRVSTVGAELLTKYQLTPPTGVVFSVAPSLGGSYFFIPDDSSTDAVGTLTATLPVLIGIPVGKHQLVLSPSMRDLVVFGGSSTNNLVGNILSIGLSVGFAIRFTDSFKMMPEVGALYPTLVTAGAKGVPFSSETLGATTLFYTVGLGFIWGNSR